MTEAIGCAHVWKRFGEVVANRDVSLSVERGTVHAVVGENGAGKSTLMRALYGMSPPDEGEVRIGGERIAQPSVEESIRRKVGMVHQHFMLVPTLSVTENVVLGAEPVRAGSLDLPRAERALGEIGARLGGVTDPAFFRRRVGELSVGEAQRVEIIKVLYRGAEVLILDEPTAVLTPLEVEELFATLKRLRAEGHTVVMVTHKLDEVMALSDRVTVLRRGAVVHECATRETTPADLARAMVGREVAAGYVRPARTPPTGEVRLSVEKLSAGGRVHDVSFTVRGGEVLGVAGVEGNGQSELQLALIGALAATSGTVRLDGAELGSTPVRARRLCGLGYVPEDRHARGLLLDFSVEDNFLLGQDDRYRRAILIDRPKLRAHVLDKIAALDIRPTDPTATARSLSGGNQQKVVIGRELSRPLSALICAQPTRGVDVGAIERIHAELEALRARGTAILLFSAELDELFALSDRLIVLRRGQVVGALDDMNAPDLRNRVGALMLGATA